MDRIERACENDPELSEALRRIPISNHKTLDLKFERQVMNANRSLAPGDSGKDILSKLFPYRPRMAALDRTGAGYVWSSAEMWPVPLSQKAAWDKSLEEMNAIIEPFKTAGNAKFREKKYVEAIKLYRRAVPHVYYEQVSKSHVALVSHYLPANSGDVLMTIYLYLQGPETSQPPKKRLAAEIFSNLCLCAIKLEDPMTAFSFAQIATDLDPSFFQRTSLRKLQAFRKLRDRFKRDGNKQMAGNYAKMTMQLKQQRSDLETYMGTSGDLGHIGVHLQAILSDEDYNPHIANVLDQLYGMSSMDKILSSNRDNKKCMISLVAALVPFRGVEQWLTISVTYLDLEIFQRREIPMFHFAQADTEGGEAVDRHKDKSRWEVMLQGTEGVHAGVSTEKAQKFCHARLPRLVEILTSNYGVEIVTMTLGQGLMELADPDYRVSVGLTKEWPGCSVMRTMW